MAMLAWGSPGSGGAIDDGNCQAHAQLLSRHYGRRITNSLRECDILGLT